MRLVLAGVRLPLAHFELALDAVLTAGATAIFGPSGAGKTTLLELVAGLRRAARGRIELDGEVLSDVTGGRDRGRGREVPARRRRIGYVPQDLALFPHLSVRGNLLYGHRPAAAAASAFTLERVTRVLEIGHLLDRGTAGLSGGEKQRVALARALLSSPRLLLLDEPLAALDGALKQRVIEDLQRARAELAVPMLYVSHDAGEVSALCEEVVVLSQGRIAGRGAPGDVLARAGDRALRVNPPW